MYLNDPVTGIGSELHPGSGSTWHDYLQADGERIGLRISTTSPVTTNWQVYISDYQGSVAVVTDITGAVTQRLGYDAWGRRRQPNGTEDPSGSITAPTSRGYTDHEHIPNVSLINMNGRVFDPEVGRFLSADPVIPNLFGTQAQNRYSYVYNNPGRYTDPSGYSPNGLNLWPPTLEGVIIGTLVDFAFDKLFGGDKKREPPQHQPGLASVNVSLRGSVPLYNVTPTGAVGMPVPGMVMYLGGQSCTAYDYTLGTISPYEPRWFEGVPIVESIFVEAGNMASVFYRVDGQRVNPITHHVLTPDEVVDANFNIVVSVGTSIIGRTAVGAAGTIGQVANTTTRNGIGVTAHSVNQKIYRQVRSADELDAMRNPLQVKPVKVDSLGRPSQRHIGKNAEVAINPETGKSVSVNPTSSKNAERRMRQQGECQ